MQHTRTVAGVLGALVLSAGSTAVTLTLASGGAGAAERTLRSPLPAIASVACVTNCSGFGDARAGSLVRLDGRALSEVTRVIFASRHGDDDAVAIPTFKRPEKLYVIVPEDADSGRVAVAAGTVRVPAGHRRLRLHRDPADVVRARISAARIFVGGRREARLDLRVRDYKPVRLTVQLVRVHDRAVLRRWRLGALAPDSIKSLVWRGPRDDSAPSLGRYRFRVFSLTGAGRVAPAVAEPAFELYDHKFPVRGPHGFGGYASRFGGGRGHQGQDVFASCGTSVQAARGGTVKLNAYHPRSGNYVVIDGAKTSVDYAYMHLAQRSPMAVGSVVHTGQELGRVGQTGRAHGCHLHFEMWSGAWRSGGQPIDPLPAVAAWDGYS